MPSYVCVSVCICVCSSVCLYVCVSLPLYVWAFVHLCLCEYASLCPCICMCPCWPQSVCVCLTSWPIFLVSKTVGMFDWRLAGTCTGWDQSGWTCLGGSCLGCAGCAFFTVKGPGEVRGLPLHCLGTTGISQAHSVDSRLFAGCHNLTSRACMKLGNH